MSGIISIKGEDSIILFTDGAVYDRQNVIRDLKRKVSASSKVPIAVATRGNEFAGEGASKTIVGWAEEFGVDEAIATFAEALDIWKLKRDRSNILEVVIAGWSETAGPTHLVFSNCPYKNTKIEMNTLLDPGTCWIGCASDGHSNPNTVVRRRRPGEAVLAHASEMGVSLMQFYRQQVAPADDDHPYPAHNIGGHVDMTVVGQVGVLVSRLHTWPQDRIGERINPFAGQKVPLTGNRHQRRAARHAA